MRPSSRIEKVAIDKMPILGGTVLAGEGVVVVAIEI
jgi:hypothetical protein